MNKTISLSDKAKLYATKCHRDTNHLYDGKPYDIHLALVATYASVYLDDFINPESWETVIAAAWAHDLIEDTRQTYNDVKWMLGEDVAEIVYALTNEKGRNRQERANKTYYQGIWKVRYARYVKLCDRLANIRYSAENKSSMLKVYKKEHPEFVKLMYNDAYKPLYEEMDYYLNR